MNSLCDALIDMDLELDIESKYFINVPYVPNDPDFDWHKNFTSTSEDESKDAATIQQSESLTKDKKMCNSSQGKHKRRIRKRRISTSPKRDSGRKFYVVGGSSIPAATSNENKFEDSPISSKFDYSYVDSGNDCNDSKIKRSSRKYRSLPIVTEEKTPEKNINIKYPSNAYVSTSPKVRSTSRFDVRESTSVYNTPRSSTALTNDFNRNTAVPRVQNLNATLPLYHPPLASFRGSNKNSYRYRNGFNVDRCSVESTEVIPTYRNYQFLGDSQLLRFAEQLLGCKKLITYTENTRRLGYCVSGQKIRDLEQRLLTRDYKLSRKIIILIGTNDFVYGTLLKSMCESFESILNVLKERTDRIVILTVPPVPKLSNEENHGLNLEKFNNFLVGCADKEKVFVVNIATLYFNYHSLANTDYFEQVFNNSSRVDLIHLNRDGFNLLKTLLDIKYFDKFESC